MAGLRKSKGINKTHVAIYLAIPMPSNEAFENDTQRSRTVLYKMLDELCGLSEQLDFGFYEYGAFKPSIELLEGKKRNERQLKKWFQAKRLATCEVLRLSVDVPLVDKNPDGVMHVFLKRTADLLIMANISRLGSLELADSVVLQDRVLEKYSGLPKMDAWPLQRAVERAALIGWPTLYALDFATVWKWVVKHDDFLDGFTNNPTGRALNAFSRLFEQAELDEAMQLVWALIGIEALFVKGKVSVMEQVREKIQLFLGKQEAYKKKIVEMYDFRSRFMHGDLDFPGLYLMADARPVFRRYSDEQSEAVELAIAILGASLQRIIRRGWTGLDFSYKVSSQPNSAP